MSPTLRTKKLIISGLFCWAVVYVLQSRKHLPFDKKITTHWNLNLTTYVQIGTTPYFETLCRRNDIISLPLQCSATSANRDGGNATMLSSLLDCHDDNSTEKMVNFFSFAHGQKYVDVLPLYTFFALQTNQDSVVEMVVENRDEFIVNHARELAWLLDAFGSSSFCVRHVASKTMQQTKIANTYRFLERPVRRAKYTYIGDVDIFLNESVLDPKRLEQMKIWNIPYSNVIRPMTTRLTGVMLVKTEEFYTPALLSEQQEMDAKGNDEMFLYKIVNASGIGLPGTNVSDPLATYRPLHGLHLSNNRGPGKRMCLPNFEPKDEGWCTVLATPRLSEFLCLDGSKIILESLAKVSQQMEKNMTHSSGICAPGRKWSVSEGNSHAGRPRGNNAVPSIEHRAGSHNYYSIVPLGCEFSSTQQKSILQWYLSQSGESRSDIRRLTKEALKESSIPTKQWLQHCTLLLPISFAQQALRQNFTFRGLFPSYLEKLVSEKIIQITGSSNLLLKLIACCLSRSMPVLSSSEQHQLLLSLALMLGLTVYWSNGDDDHWLLCGSSSRTRHSIQFKSTKDAMNECVHINELVYDRGLADSNFDTVMRHFFLHRYAVSRLKGEAVEVLTTDDDLLGIAVSGDGTVSNGGDLFGPLVADHMLQARNQSDISVVIGSVNTTPAVLAIVGSTVQGNIGRPNMMQWGTGIIKNMKVAKLNQNSTILAVRGPRSRDLLLSQQGLNPMVIGDPALIAGNMVGHTVSRTESICFVIHGVDRKYASEKCPFCMDRLVNNYDPNPRRILDSLARCQRVVSSSLHGVIFAHALGIPALPIALGDRITGGDFKYVDYMHSVGVTSFQSRISIAKVWETHNLTELDWKRMVDGAIQPEFPVRTEHFYETFPAVV